MDGDTTLDRDARAALPVVAALFGNHKDPRSYGYFDLAREAFALALAMQIEREKATIPQRRARGGDMYLT